MNLSLIAWVRPLARARVCMCERGASEEGGWAEVLLLGPNIASFAYDAIEHTDKKRSTIILQCTVIQLYRIVQYHCLCLTLWCIIHSNPKKKSSSHFVLYLLRSFVEHYILGCECRTLCGSPFRKTQGQKNQQSLYKSSNKKKLNRRGQTSVISIKKSKQGSRQLSHSQLQKQHEKPTSPRADLISSLHVHQ